MPEVVERSRRGEDAWADSIRPVTCVPESITVRPSIRIDPATEAKNGSPACTLSGTSERSNLTVRKVPEGRMQGCAAWKGNAVAGLESCGMANVCSLDATFWTC